MARPLLTKAGPALTQVVATITAFSVIEASVHSA